MNQYRKTFLRMQVFIALVTIALHAFLGRRWIPTLTFFAMMQVGSVVGALWGTRLRRLRGFAQR